MSVSGVMRFFWWVAALALLGCSPATGSEASLRPSAAAGESAGSSDAGGAGKGSGLELDPANGGGSSSTALSITPSAPVLTVRTGQPAATVAFKASSAGATVNAKWLLDRGELGSIDANGVFTASGRLGGTAHVSASYGSLTAITTVTVNLETVDHGDPEWSAQPAPVGPGGYHGVGGNGPGAPPSATQLGTLASAPTSDAALSLLYPYDGTVFPQGLLAPLLQWDAGKHAFDAVKLHISSDHYDYEGDFAANATPFVNLPIPQAAWRALTLSAGGSKATVTLTFSEGTHAVGPVNTSWLIAPAVLHGTIYYHSYGTSFVKNSPYLDAYGEQFGAGTLGIASGATSPTLAAGINGSNNGEGCRVCHTVSGDGAFMVTQAPGSVGPGLSDTVAVALGADTTAGAGMGFEAPSLAFPALSKDGHLLFSSSGGMQDGESASHLYAMPNATRVANVTGLPDNFQATLPTLSPDTRKLSFNFWGGALGSASGTLTGDHASLGVLDFDGVSAFSNPRLLYTPPPGSAASVAVTFSAFLPDSASVVFALQLEEPSQFWGYTWGQNTSELWWVDLATKTAHRLDALNGLRLDGTPYLPDNAHGAATHRAAQDATLSYEPSVSPVAAGGYAWVVFTSRRMYGNVATLDPWQSDPRKYKWHEQVTDKKLWVAAVDLNAKPGTDPSHPAFYLPAQELYAGNSRGFWSLDVCHADGQSCETGDQCCGGYCQQSSAGLACQSQTVSCSALYDKCQNDSDCCDVTQGAGCINQTCTASAPPK